MAPSLPCMQEIREKESVAALWQLLGSLVPASGVAAGVMERLPQPAAQVTVADRLGLGLPAGHHVVVADACTHHQAGSLGCRQLTDQHHCCCSFALAVYCLLTVLPQTQLH